MSKTLIERARELIALAEKATPGPWEQQLDGWTVRVAQPDTEKARGWRICMTHHSGPHRVEQEVADSAYIAAANPEAVSALCHALIAAEEQRDALKGALREHAMRCEPLHAGYWRYECLLCGGTWQTGADAERHAPGCLAAPEDAP